MTSVDAFLRGPEVTEPRVAVTPPPISSAESVWVPGVTLPPRQVRPPVRRSLGSVLRALTPYLAIYVVVGVVMVRWGGTDPSQGNVSYALEWFTIPVVVALSCLVCVPIALLSWAWGHLRRALHLTPRTPPEPVSIAAPPRPTSLSVKSQLWPARRRWMAAEGQLVFDDEKISFNPPGARRRSAASVPWSSVTTLDLRPRLSWGRGQRGHLTIGVRSGPPVELMVPRPHYDRLVTLLSTPQVDKAERAACEPAFSDS